MGLIRSGYLTIVVVLQSHTDILPPSPPHHPRTSIEHIHGHSKGHCVSIHCLSSIPHHIVRQSCCSRLYPWLHVLTRSTSVGSRKRDAYGTPEKPALAARPREPTGPTPLTMAALCVSQDDGHRPAVYKLQFRILFGVK